MSLYNVYSDFLLQQEHKGSKCRGRIEVEEAIDILRVSLKNKSTSKSTSKSTKRKSKIECAKHLMGDLKKRLKSIQSKDLTQDSMTISSELLQS